MTEHSNHMRMEALYKDKLIEMCKLLLNYTNEFDNQLKRIYTERELQAYNSFLHDSQIKRKKIQIQEKRERLLEKRESLLTFIPENSLDNLLYQEAERLWNEIECLNQEKLKIEFNARELGIDLTDLSHQSMPILYNIFLRLFVLTGENETLFKDYNRINVQNIEIMKEFFESWREKVSTLLDELIELEKLLDKKPY
jgi:hypothetical protein